MLSFFPLDILDETWDLIESVSEGFLTYFFIKINVSASGTGRGLRPKTLHYSYIFRFCSFILGGQGINFFNRTGSSSYSLMVS